VITVAASRGWTTRWPGVRSGSCQGHATAPGPAATRHPPTPGPHAMTDVTGFGLLGRGLEMAPICCSRSAAQSTTVSLVPGLGADLIGSPIQAGACQSGMIPECLTVPPCRDQRVERTRRSRAGLISQSSPCSHRRRCCGCRRFRDRRPFVSLCRRMAIRWRRRADRRDRGGRC
jgi:hypothetical protein